MKKLLIVIYILVAGVIAASCTQDMADIRDRALAKRFSDRIVETGKDSDHSLVRLTLKRSDKKNAVVTAEAWGISETGPFIKAQRKGYTLVFVMLAHCGTIESSTPVKISETYILSDVEELQIMNIMFEYKNQGITIEK